ncbi:MAG: TonB-dependent receptor [Steroidobacteraceae bacterium]
MPFASAMLAGAGVAQAQQAESGSVLEEVVVTAQKRSEDLQKVPISLQVLGAEKLEEHQVSSFDDYAKLLPSVTFQSLGPSQAQLYFRGIASGGDGLHAGSLPATGLYLDEIPVTTIAGSLDLHVYDIARVEALAGPQGTLYGASSLSGTLRMITNKPDPSKFAAGYDVKANKYTKGDPGGSFEGFVNIPLGDQAAIRLVGFIEQEGGYIDNIPIQRTYQRTAPSPEPYGDGASHPCTRNNFGGVVPDPCSPLGNPSTVKKNANSVTSAGGRAALKVNLNDSWSITPMLMYQHQKANGDFTFLYPHPPANTSNPRDLTVTDFIFGRNVDQWYQTALTVEGKIGNFDLTYAGGYFERRIYNIIDYADYTLAYDTYGSGYTYWADPAGNNIADPTQYTVNRDKYTKLSHEIRLSTPQDNRLRAVVGAFMQRQSDYIQVDFSVDGLPANHQVAKHPNVLYRSDQNRTDRDKAVFGEITYDVTDSLKLTGGIRKFWVDNTLYGFFGYGIGVLAYGQGSGEKFCSPADYAEAAGTSMPCINTRKRVTEGGETHKINLQWQIDPDRMVYGTYSTGFRPGGNNRRPEIVAYAADRLSNFEIGWKTAWLDRHVRLNGAVFFEKWKGAQYGIQGVNGITSILNAGDAESKGIEGDVSWAASDALMLTFSGTYVKAKLTTNFCSAPDGVVTSNCTADSVKPDPVLVAPAGTQLPVTPKFKANASARYKFNVAGLDSFVQASLSHQGSTSFSLEASKNAIVGETPSYTSLDLSGGFGKDKWNVEAFIQNVTDKRGILGFVSQCNTDICDAGARAYGIKPRLIGVKFGQKF